MNPNQKDYKIINAHKDVTKSVFIGPLRFVVPIVGHFIIYPIILRDSGMKVIGLWSLLTTIVSYISLTDMGFSLLLIREAGKDQSQEKLRELYKDYIASKRFYLIVCFIILAIFLISYKIILGLIGSLYHDYAFLLSVFFLIIGSTLYLIANLDAAIISSRNENYYVQFISAVALLITYSSAICGACIGFPIEGYSLGTILGGISQNCAFRWRILKYHQPWISSCITLTWSSTFHQLFSLIRRGWYFYSISIGFVLRESTFRWIIAFLLGLETVGIYAIAQRLTMAARHLIASGFSALYPSLSFFDRTRRMGDTKELIRVSLLFLLFFGAGCIGIVIMLADFILFLWLGDVPRGAVSSIQILGLWNVITLVSIPFWYLLQASGHEKRISFTLWLHVLLVLFLILLHRLINIDLFFSLCYWLITGLFTQSLIYYYAEREFSIFWKTVLNPFVITLVILIIIFLSISLTIPLSQPKLGTSILTKSLYIRILPIAIYVIFGSAIMWFPLREYLFRKGRII